MPLHRLLGSAGRTAGFSRSLHCSAASGAASGASGRSPPAATGLGLTPLQVKAGAKVHRALCEALHSGSLASRFLQGSGFSFLEVRMSPDLRRAYVRWSVMEGHEELMERELARSAVPLRSCVATLVGLKHTPELHFRRMREGESEQEKSFAAAWRQLEMEREEEAAPDAKEAIFRELAEALRQPDAAAGGRAETATTAEEQQSRDRH